MARKKQMKTTLSEVSNMIKLLQSGECNSVDLGFLILMGHATLEEALTFYVETSKPETYLREVKLTRSLGDGEMGFVRAKLPHVSLVVPMLGEVAEEMQREDERTLAPALTRLMQKVGKRWLEIEAVLIKRGIKTA